MNSDQYSTSKINFGEGSNRIRRAVLNTFVVKMLKSYTANVVNVSLCMNKHSSISLLCHQPIFKIHSFSSMHCMSEKMNI